MRTLLLAALAAASVLAGTASAQSVFGPPSTNKGVTLPSYAGKSGNLSTGTYWGSKLFSWMPNFRSQTRPGTITEIPDPERNPGAYLAGFGFRRLR